MEKKKTNNVEGCVKNILHTTKKFQDVTAKHIHITETYKDQINDLCFNNSHLTPKELIIEVLDVKVDKEEDELEKTNIVAHLLQRFEIKELY